MSQPFEPTGPVWETAMGDRLKLIPSGVNAGLICRQNDNGTWITYRKPATSDEALKLLKDLGAPPEVCALMSNTALCGEKENDGKH